MSAVEAAKVFHQQLWDYERQEIIDYESIYFFNV